MNDEELKDLFSAFDDVSASDSLKSATLENILAAAAAEAEVASEDAATSTTGESTEQLAAVEQSTTKPAMKAARGGKFGMRNKMRTIRVAAVAACLTLALSGGVAYATPASSVMLTQGETTIELEVNVFGMVLSASASDEAGQKIIDEMGPLGMTQNYEDLVDRLSDSMQKSNPEVPVAVVREAGGVTEALREQSVEDQPEAPSSMSESTNSSEKADQPERNNGEPTQEAPGAEVVQIDNGAQSNGNGSAYVPPQTGVVGDNSNSAANNGKQTSGKNNGAKADSGKQNGGNAGENTNPNPSGTTADNPAPTPSTPDSGSSTPGGSSDNTPSGNTDTPDQPQRPSDTDSSSDDEDGPQRYDDQD